MKWCGKIGFLTTELEDGIYSEKIVEKTFVGEMIKNRVDVQNTNNLNDDLVLNNQISILASKFVYDNYSYMKYVEVLGVKWKIRSAEIQYPRLLLSLGGVWNGDMDEESTSE